MPLCAIAPAADDTGGVAGHEDVTELTSSSTAWVKTEENLSCDCTPVDSNSTNFCSFASDCGAARGIVSGS